MPTKAYSQATVDQMRADLRVMDARILELEASKRKKEAQIRLSDFEIDYIEHREIRDELNRVKRKRRETADRVWRITGMVK